MTDSLQPFIRNLLRYGAGALLAAGFLPQEVHDQFIDLSVLGPIAGVIMSVISGVWYRYAKNNDKPT